MNKMNLRTKVGEIKTKMLNGLSYTDAKKELQPFIDDANIKCEKLAKEAGRSFNKLTFNYVIR